MASGARRQDRVAVISDVHGNVTALEAVLADIEARGITRVLNLGDVVGKGPRGSEAVKLSRETCEVTVRGNWDTFISRNAVQPFAGGQFARDELSDEDVRWLAALPNAHELVMSGRRIRLFHASQTSEFVRVRVRHTREEFLGMFTNTDFTGDFRAGPSPAGTTPDVVGYGDIHSTFLEADEGLTLFNAGAVGNHLDAPTAPYVLLEGKLGSLEPEGFSISFVRVPYDIEAEIAVARDVGMPDVEAYALELREGIYRGNGTPSS
ncbi:metallophosphoesterase family protein [Intrasporangium calvum]|uniref:metallophosphoesterase family protein n=1 Tax=Intrasporangium calvum TaxID=53358 RepID=UPI001F249319|nr:metallophosphoesterase family protein [Intrasporangium calvum]